LIKPRSIGSTAKSPNYLVFLIDATGALVTDFFDATWLFFTVHDFAHFAGAAEVAGAANAGTTVAISNAPARNNDVDLVFMIQSP